MSGILSLFFGVIGVLLSYWYVGIVPCAIGLALGIVGMIDSYLDSKSSIMGLLLSLLGTVASIFFVVSDLDSGALALNARKFGGEMISSIKGDDFMRFHQDGWTPEQAGTELTAREMLEGNGEKQDEEKVTPYWIHDSENKTLEIGSNIENTKEESVREEPDQSVSLQSEEQGYESEEGKADAAQEQTNTGREVENSGRWQLYSDQNVTISYDGMYRNDYPEGYNVKLIVENLSDKTFMVQCRETSVNGYMVEPICSMVVAPGKKIADNMTIYGEDAERAPYGSVNSIETKFIIYNNDDWVENYQTENIIIK